MRENNVEVKLSGAKMPSLRKLHTTYQSSPPCKALPLTQLLSLPMQPKTYLSNEMLWLEENLKLHCKLRSSVKLL